MRGANGPLATKYGSRNEESVLNKTIGRLTRAPRRVRWRTICGAAILCAAAWAAAAGGPPSRGVDPRPARAAASSPTLRPVAHVGGIRRGLVVDGDDVYIGEGADVVALRLDADGQLTVLHRTPLPEVVTSLAIAPEMDRLYAATIEGVYALDIASGRPPTVVDGVAVPLFPDGNIVAQGEVVYVHLGLDGEGKVRCVGAVTFSGVPTRGMVGPSACAADSPEGLFGYEDQLTLGDGVLVVHGFPAFNEGIPDLALFDVRQPSRPVFKRSLDVEGDVQQALAAGTRLWLMMDGADSARSFDVSDLDREPIEVAGASSPTDGPIDRMVLAEDTLWLMGYSGAHAFDPNATGTAPTKYARWINHYSVSEPPYGWMAITRHALLTLDGSGLTAYQVPPDDAHFVAEPSAQYVRPFGLGRVTAAGGRAFAVSLRWLYPWTYTCPAALAPGDDLRLPLDPSIAQPGRFEAGAAQLDAQNVVVLQQERLSLVHVPFAGEATLAGAWTISTIADEDNAKIVAVEAAAGRAVILRASDLHAADLARPGEPAGHLEGRWRFARGLAVGPEWAAVLSGGYPHSSEPWDPPRIVLVDPRPSPPVVLGELTLADRQGSSPVGIRAVDDYLVVALTRRSHGEVVVVDARDPAAPAVVGRLAMEGDSEVRSIAASGANVIVGGLSRVGRDSDAPADWPQTRSQGRLWLVDVSTPEQPVLRDTRAVPSVPTAIMMDGNVVLVSTSDAGLWRFDLVGPDDRPARVWRLALPWMAPGERPLRGQPVKLRATAQPRPTSAP